MYELEYDSKLDQFTKVIFNEFSDSSDEEEDKTNIPLLILKRRKIKRKVRSTLTNFTLPKVISRSGKLNVFLTKLSNKNLSYIKDLGNTLLGIQWKWILITLIVVNFVCFFVFGLLWYGIAISSGDFDQNNTDFCVINTRTLTGYFLLSAETITTIGYGYRYPTEQCKLGWLMLMLQVLLSVAVQGVLVSIVYVKITKPISATAQKIFSKKAVICIRDGKLRFVFRINDFTKKIWCSTYISLYFVDKELVFPNAEYDMIQMKIEPHGLLIFPLEIEHVIDEESPLWSFRPLDVLQSRFEIIAVAEGSSNITGQISQNRTSYSNSDILWGHRFEPCVNYDEAKNRYVVDYKKFKQTKPFDTPLCSAKKLKDIRRKISLQE